MATSAFDEHSIEVGLTPELRHRPGNLTLAAMMMSKFHGPVKTEGAVAVACSDLLGNGRILTRTSTMVSVAEKGGSLSCA